jgi:ligand-binding sensor domain-containing protein
MRRARLSALLFLLPWLAAGARGAAPPAEGQIAFLGVPVPDEVPAHLCSALAQDRDGFLWIGTQGGLVRYDGYQFRVYKNDPRDSGSLSGSYVRSLFAAADGRLWVGTFSSGLSAFDPATETFTRYQHDPRLPGSLSHDRVETIAEDRSGRLWIATYGGLDRLDPKSGRIEHFRHDAADPRSLADDQVRGVLVDRSGQLWVGSRDGLQVWRGEGRGFERRASDPQVPGSLAGELVAKLYEDARGRIWIGTTEHGAAILDPRSGALTRLLPQPGSPAGLSHFWVYGFTEVAAGEVWVATFGGGIDVVDPGSLTVIARLRHDPTRDASVGGDRIGAILRDRSGVVWVGTWGHGIARYDPAARAFQAIQYRPDRPGPLGPPGALSHPEAVRALEMRDGTIWVGTNGNGIDILDGALAGTGRRIGGYRPDPANPDALADGSVTCLAQAADGTIWVATLNGMLHRLRPGGHRFERLSTADGLPGGPIHALTFGPDGALWAGAAEGLARIDPGSGRIQSYRHRPEAPATLSGTAVEALAWGSDGTL